jgi:MFS transporter, PHS family, inorganic phosphate transporter
MVAAVFFCQPLGQLMATLFALAATEGFKKTMLKDSGPDGCSMNATDARGIECARNIDRTWRLVSGLGLFPAALALVSRLTIPESMSLSCE